MKRFSSIVITGASSGIGEALALDYAAPGVALALTGRDAQRLEAVAQACRRGFVDFNFANYLPLIVRYLRGRTIHTDFSAPSSLRERQ